MVPPFFAAGIVHQQPHNRYIGRTRTGCYPRHLRSGFNLRPVRLALNIGSLSMVSDLLVSFINLKYVILKHMTYFTSRINACQDLSFVKIATFLTLIGNILCFLIFFEILFTYSFFSSHTLSTSKAYYANIFPVTFLLI